MTITNASTSGLDMQTEKSMVRDKMIINYFAKEMFHMYVNTYEHKGHWQHILY